MKVFLVLLLGLTMAAVVGVLIAGMFGLVRGGGDPRRSNALMRWRVVLQAAAIVIFMVLMLLLRGS